MARMPGVIWRGEQSPRRSMSRYDIVCIHTIVGYAPAHAAHFSTSGDGDIYQSRDTRYRSAANLNGNHRVISIENADHGSMFGSWSGDNVPPFTSAQIEAIAQICAWAHKEHGIPLAACPNSRPGSRGIAFHRQGIDGNFGGYRFPGRVSGGEVWTSAYGKVCPGDNRIAQMPEIIERARQIAGGAPVEEEDPLPEPKDLWTYPLRDAYGRKVTAAALVQDGSKAKRGVAELKESVADTLEQATNAKVGAVQAREEAIKAKSAAVASRNYARSILIAFRDEGIISQAQFDAVAASVPDEEE